MAKPHFVVLKSEDGGVSLYRMKECLRQNPVFIPEGLDPTIDTSHTLRAALHRSGWGLEEKADQVLVIKPDDYGAVNYAETIRSEPNEEQEIEKEILEAEELTFGLERDLQQALRAKYIPA